MAGPEPIRVGILTVRDGCALAARERGFPQDGGAS